MPYPLRRPLQTDTVAKLLKRLHGALPLPFLLSRLEATMPLLIIERPLSKERVQIAITSSPPAPKRIPTSRGLRLCQAPGPSVPPASSSPVAHHATAIPLPRHSPHTPASRRGPTAAARSPGAPGAGSVRRASDHRAWQGRQNPRDLPSGPRSIPSSNATRAKPTKPPSARWRSRGSAVFCGVGRSVPRRGSPSLSRRFIAVGHPSSEIRRRRPEKS